MDIRTLTPDYSVSPQLRPEDLRAVAAAGFRTVICNRPDAEVGNDLAAARMQEAAEAAGITWAENVVISGAMTLDNISTQGRLVAQLPGPVLAYCRSGTRSATVWALSQAGRMEPDAILAATGAAGYALEGLRGQIEALAQQAG